jgi:hypothetical protein
MQGARCDDRSRVKVDQIRGDNQGHPDRDRASLRLYEGWKQEQGSLQEGSRTIGTGPDG